jgi:hypothetical protein
MNKVLILFVFQFCALPFSRAQTDSPSSINCANEECKSLGKIGGYILASSAFLILPHFLLNQDDSASSESNFASLGAGLDRIQNPFE